MTPHRSFSSAESLGHRERDDGDSAARLEQRIAALRAEIASAQRKRHGIDDAITSRSKTLTRLEAQLILERGGASSDDT